MHRGVIIGIVVVGLAAGFGIGIAIGWGFPINAPQTSPAALAPMWQADYILMTAQAYSLDGNLTTAQQRLQELGYTDPSPSSEQTLGAIVAQRGLEAIAENLPPEDIGCLARLAAALGTRLPELEPYLAK
jgi:hypothetical protein